MSVLFVIFSFILGLGVVSAQQPSDILTYQSYINKVVQQHPLAKQSNLKLEGAQASALAAKGSLDPKLSFTLLQKSFKGKRYYSNRHAEVKVPTALGLSFLAAYENTDGQFLNPENSTDEFGLWYLGIEADILQGLFVNERRLALDQAEIDQSVAKNDQRIILNDLIYSATVAYVNWQQYEGFDEVLEDNLSIADTYLENTKIAFINGEKTAMDTLEAFILYQDALTWKQANQLGLIKSKQSLENFMWSDGEAVLLDAGLRPESYQTKILERSDLAADVDLSTHPIMLNADNKIQRLSVAQRLKREKLKPKLKVKYNPLLKTTENSVSPSYSINDYKIGLEFSAPLLFRKERAAVQQGEIKLAEATLLMNNKRNELQNKVDNSLLQLRQIAAQLSLIENNVANYKRLLEGETEKFNLGESSVFLLNKRREKYISGQLKLIKTYTKQQLEQLSLYYYSNQLQ